MDRLPFQRPVRAGLIVVLFACTTGCATRAAQDSGDAAAARRLAEQAAADAEVARARMAADHARRAADEIEASVAALREEFERTAQP